ncbi:hypothetical protein FSP39_011417 [Pinctada imbricata]|uniref:c-SKI SMAD4-binding domain-containing protein n=1 Tax=Pinctada imbricata TaxID=66713 RepID=A0AA88YCG1_PINIB|nr:hypothetical protein FSP39_011417 [Pinctada imbricata]
MRSLQGPGPGVYPTLLSDMAELEQYRKALAKKLPTEKGLDYDSVRVAPPYPVQQIPVFTPVDPGKSDRLDTTLEDEKIACFVVGGEKRLCLPQILNTVLRDFSLDEINAVCDELHIFCSRCNHEQLNTLKITGILPLSAPSCGLITKTDAERLCNALLHRTSAQSSRDVFYEHRFRDSFKVYHECFGKCKGIFSPENYSNPNSKCIQCCDCMGLFCPQKFVCHSHRAQENQTCHWGFDSANWRSYLLLAKDQESHDRLQGQLEKMKLKFDSNKNKRKQISESNTELKRSKSEDNGSNSLSPSASWTEGGARTMSAFRPWSPTMISAMKEGKTLLPAAPAIMKEGGSSSTPSFLQTGPPVLLNPERVIPHSESSRYERGFAPNVSLAPRSQQKSQGDSEEEEEEEEEVQVDDKAEPRATTSEYREWDLPSESDDSSHLSDGEEPSSKEWRTFFEKGMDLLHRSLDGKTNNSEGKKEELIGEFTHLQTQCQEHVHALWQENSSLKKELISLKQELREKKQDMKEKVLKMNEKNTKLEKDTEKIRIESECRLEEAQEEKEKLMKEVTRLQNQEEIEASKYIQRNHELQARLQHYEIAYEKLYCDAILLQEELKRHGSLSKPDLLSKQKFNGCYLQGKSSPPSRESTSSGNSPNSLLHSKTFSIKKEQDS